MPSGMVRDNSARADRKWARLLYHAELLYHPTQPSPLAQEEPSREAKREARERRQRPSLEREDSPSTTRLKKELGTSVHHTNTIHCFQEYILLL